MRVVFLDTETTGLDPDRCEIWEIGAIVRDDDQPDVEYCWQIRPTMASAEPTGLRIGRYYERNLMARAPIGEALAVVHPNIPADLAPGEIERYFTTRTVAGELTLLLDGAYLVGAVPWFDERFLQRFLAKHSQALTSHYHLVDVETLAAGQLLLTPPWGFDDILKAYDLVYDEADRHTALGDARMVRDLYDQVYDQLTEAADGR